MRHKYHMKILGTAKSSPLRKRNEKTHNLHLLAEGFPLGSLKSSTLLPRQICQNWDASGVGNRPFLGLNKDVLFLSKGRVVTLTGEAGRQPWVASGSSFGEGMTSGKHKHRVSAHALSSLTCYSFPQTGQGLKDHF